MRLGLVFGVIGTLLKLFAIAFVVPIAFGIWEVAHGRAEAVAIYAFVVAAVVAGGGGRLLSRSFRRNPSLRRSEALGVVAGTWLTVAAAAAVPYLFYGLNPVDAFFESLSGLTTTGATILRSFEAHDGVHQLDRVFFLWRGMTQWFGGLGVIALFVVILPRLGIAGRQIFFAEASTAAGESISPQIRQSSRRLWVLYTALTAAEVGALMLTGFPLYESVVHSFTTMSAGGFSPHAYSIMGYGNHAAEWVFIVFMVLSGTSFTLQYRAFTKRPSAFLKDQEFVVYFLVMLGLTLGAAALMSIGGEDVLDSLRTSAFQITSLASSTGYASADFELWNDSLKTFLVLAMVFGGCAGSACGGAKVIRYILTTSWLKRELTQVLHPRAVIPIRYRGVSIPPQVMRAVTTLVFLYIIGYAIVGALLVILEPDLPIVTGFSAALACLGNIGPAFGDAGPMGSYEFLSAPAKILLALSMWIGRLEIVTVIALFHPHVWKTFQWQAETRLP